MLPPHTNYSFAFCDIGMMKSPAINPANKHNFFCIIKFMGTFQGNHNCVLVLLVFCCFDSLFCACFVFLSILLFSSSSYTYLPLMSVLACRKKLYTLLVTWGKIHVHFEHFHKILMQITCLSVFFKLKASQRLAKEKTQIWELAKVDESATFIQTKKKRCLEIKGMAR